jgi:hypothetical protein
MFERHSLKSGRVFCNRSNLQTELPKGRKASGNGEYNLIKYIRRHHHTRYEATMCPARILASQPSNTILNILKSPCNCVRKTHWEGASNKKSIRWIYCLRARVNDASDYQWGVRLSTEKKFAASPMIKKNTSCTCLHAARDFYAFRKSLNIPRAWSSLSCTESHIWYSFKPLLV